MLASTSRLMVPSLPNLGYQAFIPILLLQARTSVILSAPLQHGFLWLLLWSAAYLPLTQSAPADVNPDMCVSEQGVDMLLSTYHQVLGKTCLQGPLQLMPVLQGAVAEVQSAPQPHNSYHLLVIAISGSPADLPSVQALLPHLAALSLSVLLIGIGDGGFEPLQVCASPGALPVAEHIGAGACG